MIILFSMVILGSMLIFRGVQGFSIQRISCWTWMISIAIVWTSESSLFEHFHQLIYNIDTTWNGPYIYIYIYIYTPEV